MLYCGSHPDGAQASTLYYRRGVLCLEQCDAGTCLQNVMLALQCRAGAAAMQGLIPSTPKHSDNYAGAAHQPELVAARGLVASHHGGGQGRGVQQRGQQQQPPVTFRSEQEEDNWALTLEMVRELSLDPPLPPPPIRTSLAPS
jgi:hypothetical protein